MPTHTHWNRNSSKSNTKNIDINAIVNQNPIFFHFKRKIRDVTTGKELMIKNKSK